MFADDVVPPVLHCAVRRQLRMCIRDSKHAFYVNVSHVRELMPGLGELDFIKFGLNGLAKAKSDKVWSKWFG